MSLQVSLVFSIQILLIFSQIAHGELNEHNKKLSWLVGKWRSEFSGKIVWPTVPTMTYGNGMFPN